MIVHDHVRETVDFAMFFEEMRYFVGLSDREVADVSARPLGTVKTVIRRGLQMMKEAFHE